MSKYRHTIYYDFKSRFLVIFSFDYRHRLVFKIPFPDHIFPKILKKRTENLYYPSTDKYYFFSKRAVLINTGHYPYFLH